MIPFDNLTSEQQAAAKAAARLVEDAGLKFLFMLFGKDNRGALIGNIEPRQSVTLIEGALAAAKANVEVDLIEGDRLQ